MDLFIPLYAQLHFTTRAVILMLLAYIISTVIVPNQNKEDIVPMENMTTLEGDNFSEMVLPIE